MKKTVMLIFVMLVLTVSAIAAESIIFTFNSEQDIRNNIVSGSDMTISLEDGYVKLTSTTTDPRFDLPVSDLGLDASQYKHMKIRIKSMDNVGNTHDYQIFCETTKSGSMGSEGTWKNDSFTVADGFNELEIDLTAMSAYKEGIVKRLRIDPMLTQEPMTVYIDYIALFDHEYKMHKFPEIITDEDVEEMLRQELENSLRPKTDKIVFPFRSRSDYNDFVTYEYSQKIYFDGIDIVLENYNSDPHIAHEFSYGEYFYAEDFPYLKLRFKSVNSTGKKRLAQFFFSTNKGIMGEDDGTYINFYFDENGKWQDIIIDLKNSIKNSSWSDIVKEIRFDHIASNDVVPVKLEYIALFPTKEAAQAYELPALLPQEAHGTVTINAGPSNIIIPAGTISA